MEEPKGQPLPAGGEPQGQPSAGEPPKSGEPDNGKQLIDLGNGKHVEPETLVKMWGDTQSEISRLQKESKKLDSKGEDKTPEQVAEQAELEKAANALLPFLKKAGVATSDSVSALQEGQVMDKFMAANPDLAAQKELLTTLKKSHPEMPLSDIAHKYNLKSKPATPGTTPSGDVVGDPGYQKKTETSIDDVSDADSLEKFEKEQGIGQPKDSLTKRRSV